MLLILRNVSGLSTAKRKVTTLNFCPRPYRTTRVFGWLAVALLILPLLSWSQTTPQEAAQEAPEETQPVNPGYGHVGGTITDESGAPLRNATVTIRGKATQTIVTDKTNASGAYTSEQVPVGPYEVQVELKDFQTVQLRVMVKSGVTVRADTKMLAIHPGSPRLSSSAPGSDVSNRPIDGRNFLDLAQLEPGVQVIDGAALDPTKTGFFALSVDDRSGRTTRLRLDGVDINDEKVGTTTQNVASSAGREVEVTRSEPDVSFSLSAAGAVNVVTKSGSDDLHGSAFYNYRDKSAGFANLPGGLDLPFKRHQVGGAVGGTAIKDKLYFFLSGEYTKQDGQNGVAMAFPFNLLSGGYSAPFRETMGLGRLDWKVKPGMRAFYRFSYDNSRDVWGQDFSPFLNVNNAPSHGLGVDFNQGIYTHSIRFGYSRLNNHLSQSSAAGSVLDPAPNLNLHLGGLQTGPSALGPETTLQSNLQARYEGSRPWQSRYGPHTIRFGAAFSRIEIGGVTSYGALAPSVSGSPTLANIEEVLNNANSPFAALVSGDPAGRADNPLNYLVNGVTIYNGNGFSSNKSAFGYPRGGHFDNRVEAYLGDTWKVRHNLNVTLGVNYARDTGRTDSNLAPVTCSQVNTTLFPAPPCSGNTLLLDQFGFIPGLGGQVLQPNQNLSPQAGLAWDPGSNGKTVVRVGGGLFFDNNLFNTVLWDQRSRSPQGAYFGTASLCPSGTVLFPDGTRVSSIDGLNIATQICGQAIGNVATAVSDLQTAYQAATRALGAGTNPFFVGNTLSTFGSTLAPGYRSPRVVNMNVGIQHEIRRGSVLSIDFVRSVGTHSLLGVDTNQVGNASHVDVSAGVQAINSTIANNALTSSVCAPADSAGSSSLTAVNCYLQHVPGASIVDFARNGLDSGNAYCGGYACSVLGKKATFSGINALVGSNVMYFPVGKSVYNGVQLGLRTGADNPARGIRRMDLVISYTLSRYKDNMPSGNGAVGNQDALTRAQDYIHTTRYFGPSSLDRTHQISLGPVFELPRGLRLSMIGHFASPLPVTLYLPQAGGGGVPGEIFRSDVTGDGTVGDVLLGTKPGDLGRGVNGSSLNTRIKGYDNVFAGSLTPAGGQLVNSLLFTANQLVTLGAVTPTIQTPPAGNAAPQWLKTLSLRLTWPIKVREGLTIEPSVSAYNALNIANFDAPQALMSGILDASPGLSANNSTNGCGNIPNFCTARANRLGQSSGTYSLAAPRQLEFGVHVTF
jgi:hypothetical protein